jgi:hypothetical protein
MHLIVKFTFPSAPQTHWMCLEQPLEQGTHPIVKFTFPSAPQTHWMCLEQPLEQESYASYCKVYLPIGPADVLDMPGSQPLEQGSYTSYYKVYLPVDPADVLDVPGATLGTGILRILL